MKLISKNSRENSSSDKSREYSRNKKSVNTTSKLKNGIVFNYSSVTETLDIENLNKSFRQMVGSHRSNASSSSSSSSSNNDDYDYVPMPIYPFDKIKCKEGTIDLYGKVAIVTGVSKGQGRSIARELRNKGMIVIGTCRHPGGPFIKPAFAPQSDPVADGDCDYLLELELTDDSSIQNFSDAVHTMFGGVLSGKTLTVLVHQANRLSLGDVVLNQLSPGSQAAMRPMAKLGYDAHSHLNALLLDLLPSNGYARLIFTVSVEGVFSVSRSNQFGVYAEAKHALNAYTKNFREWLNHERAINPALYSKWRVTTVNPVGVRTFGGTVPAFDSFGDQGPVLGANPDPNFIFLFNFIPGTAYVIDPEMTGALVCEVAESKEPPINVLVCNNPQLITILQNWNPKNGALAGLDVRYQKELDQFYNVNLALSIPETTLMVGFPHQYDIVPKAISPFVLVHPFMGPIDQTNVPITAIAFPIGDPNFEFEYRINNGSWQGGFTFGVPFAPLYTTFVDLSSYSGSDIKIEVMAVKWNGKATKFLPSGNFIEKDLTSFTVDIYIE